jgi:hypothetical protein
MEIHRLSNVDLQAKTAVCSVCGPTDIRIRRERGNIKRSCATKHRAALRAYQQRKQAEFREGNAVLERPHSPHVLSNIDYQAKAAVCAICGLIDVRIVGGNLMCGNRHREYMREYARRRREQHRKQNSPRPHQRVYGTQAHLLSEIDDENRTAVCSQCGPVKIYISRHSDGNYTTRRCSKANSQNVMTAARNRRDSNRVFIDNYKVERGCQRCGYNASPIGLDFHHRNPAEKDFNITKVSKYSRERLLQEIEKCDVLCAICHRLVHDELCYTY